jgi:hypothetical protein
MSDIPVQIENEVFMLGDTIWADISEDVKYKKDMMWAGHLRAIPCISSKGIRKGFCCGQDLETPSMMRIASKQRDVLINPIDKKAMMWIRVFTTPQNKTYVQRARLVLFEKINKYIK